MLFAMVAVLLWQITKFIEIACHFRQSNFFGTFYPLQSLIVITVVVRTFQLRICLYYFTLSCRQNKEDIFVASVVSQPGKTRI